ncbi:MAG TPA: hypothetical protein VL084_07315 [Thermoanaerobaculia bacterium]|nr:hypothetical protein [Thermoanaerobaculia bacterium]
MIVPEGTRRPNDVTALGRRIEVRGDVDGAVVSTFGGVLVTGRVNGPVVAIGGDVVLAGNGRVEGDVLAVGGAVRFDGAASAARSVGGRVRSLGALEAAFLSELRTSPLAGAAVSPLLLSFRLFLLFLWLAVALLLLRTVPRALGDAATRVPGRLVLLGALGTSAVLTGLLVASGFVLALPAKAGLALAAVLVTGLYAAKLWGLAALFLAAGRRLLRGARRGGALFGDPAALAAGLLALGLPSLVPAVGPLLWALVSVVAIGVAVRTVAVREPQATRAPLESEAA